MAKKKVNKEEIAEVHDELSGFDIRIDPFGNVSSNLSIDRIKEFLDDKIDDKKLKHLKGKSEEE